MKRLFSESFGQGPDIVLLHGWGLHSGIWQFIAKKLSEEFRVTLIDLPGFGRSQMIAEYSISNIAEHILLVAPERAIWMGWSLGGLIATKVATLFPERVRKLICVASSPKFLKDDRWPGMELAILQKFNEDLADDYEATLMRFLLLQFHGTTLNKEMLRWLNLNLFLYGRPRLETLNAGLALLENEDLRDDVGKLHCPILYILGKLDTLVPVKVARYLSKLRTDVHTVVFPKANHALFLSHENEFLTEVRSFSHE